MDAANKRRGRKPGSLIRSTCCLCNAVELTSGSGWYYRCTECKAAGRVRVGSRREDVLGKTAAVLAVHAEIREGRMPHPTTLRCTDCDEPASQYEHRDYSKPLNVQPICRSCNHKRGPALPLAGSLEWLVSSGQVPYTLRVRTAQLFTRLGIESDALQSMPKRLSIDHWRVLMDEIAAA